MQKSSMLPLLLLWWTVRDNRHLTYIVNGQIREIFINLRKIRWVTPGSIKEVFKCWNREGNAAKEEGRWNIVLARIWWSIWEERNQICFENKQCNIQKFKTNYLGLFYFWCKKEFFFPKRQKRRIMHFLFFWNTNIRMGLDLTPSIHTQIARYQGKKKKA